MSADPVNKHNIHQNYKNSETNPIYHIFPCPAGINTLFQYIHISLLVKQTVTGPRNIGQTNHP